MCACRHTHKSSYVKIIIKKGFWEGLEGRKGERKLCNSTSIKNICKKRNQGKVVTLVKALLCNNRAKRGPD